MLFIKDEQACVNNVCIPAIVLNSLKCRVQAAVTSIFLAFVCRLVETNRVDNYQNEAGKGKKEVPQHQRLKSIVAESKKKRNGNPQL